MLIDIGQQAVKLLVEIHQVSSFFPGKGAKFAGDGGLNQTPKVSPAALFIVVDEEFIEWSHQRGTSFPEDKHPRRVMPFAFGAFTLFVFGDTGIFKL
ncbi:hypothetical protein DDR33_24065 [Pararcticibacter amylolyticus]|uniref:Uncharacterized protein n=1 Tax=Pararcticibacter amylolyticus TaxID=2173175 RepID=A0A2U2P9M0_9SPHI|nr:hypothetical protein DDR33_24065 [Pararcticibacter amylolyticus]